LRNFILFIRRFFNLILFLGLEVICILLITRTNTMQGNDIVSSANVVSGLLYKKQNDVVYYFGLRKMNDSLINENASLRKQLSAYNTVDTLKDVLVKKLIPSTDTLKHIARYADYKYYTAHVINNSVSAANNYITINRGSSSGLRNGMAVITGSGTVGKVVHVTSGFASVISILSIRQPVSAKLKDGSYGKINWGGESPDILEMRDVPQQIKVKKGDSVLTTSYSFFPADVLIGTVYKIEVSKKDNMQMLYIHPAVNFRNLQYVYVVENILAEERKTLEDSTKGKP